jgi:hypothetical protein
MRAAGFDPGSTSGGSTILDWVDGVSKVVDSIDLPVLGSGAQARLDVHLLQQWLLDHAPVQAFVERASAWPKQGVASAFRYGRACGQIETVIALCNIPVTYISPGQWKSQLHLRGKDKEQSRQRAIETWPAAAKFFARRKTPPGAQPGLIEQQP